MNPISPSPHHSVQKALWDTEMQEEGENSLLELPGIQAEYMCLRKKHNIYSKLGCI